MRGNVYLVGAGPGDPGLITVKGLELLRRADVVLYDRLISHELLNETRADAERIDVGKSPQEKRLDQSDINSLMIEKAGHGKQVVRLKGGDPFVFGRGGEEALACYKAGIPFEIVPGITSAVAVSAYAGVPVTHRNIASAFTVFTDHEDPSKPGSLRMDYLSLAAAARLGTLVLLMGVSHLPQITSQLIAAGINKDTPALCVEWGTTARQRVIEGTLSTLAEKAIVQGIQAPALTIIGEVVSLRSAGLNWFG